MKKVLIVMLLLGAIVLNIEFSTSKSLCNFSLEMVKKATAQTENNCSGQVVRDCYDSYDSPSIWVDDYFARICTSCDMYEGHDFKQSSKCRSCNG